jgi:hypothetical protein
VRVLSIALLLASPVLVASPLPPLVCPAGGAIGTVDLRVTSPSRGGGEPLPLRTINRIEEGDTLVYRPVLRSGEHRKGEVTFVLVPVNKIATGEKLLVLDPKSASRPEAWQVPWRVSVVAFVYGPSGLNTKKVKNFLSRDDDLVVQLADYAEKTAQTEALIAALSSPDSSSAVVQSALQGFAAQYGLNVQLDKTAPTNQQALLMFRTLNPAVAGYDPISSSSASAGVGQTAGLATSVAAFFFGSPVGLAAGGTAMVMELRAMAFPRAEFRSSFSEPMPHDALGLCGKRDPAPPHTRVAYLWATRVPNVGPPQLAVEKANSLPVGVKSPLPLAASDADWKYVERARDWTLQAKGGKPVPVKAHKLGDSKTMELDLPHSLKPGEYTLAGYWDWDRFAVKGQVNVRPLPDLAGAHLSASSQDLLVAKTGKVPVTIEGSDFEFVTKVQMERLNDKFASPERVPFVLPEGLRRGPQNRMDIQVNTIDLDPGKYKLMISELDGKTRTVDLKVLTAPPTIDDLPIVMNQGISTIEFELRGQRLNLLKSLEVAKGKAKLDSARDADTTREVTLHMSPDIAAGTSLAIRAYIRDRSEPLTFADAVRIVGPRPRITEVRLTQPPDQDVQLAAGELPGGLYLSAMMRVEHLQSNSVVRLTCQAPGAATLELHLGERSGLLSLQQLAPDQIFLSFDTNRWLNGCMLTATVANGREGASDPYKLGTIVRVPEIDQFVLTSEDAGNGRVIANLTGQNLETIDKVGWSATGGEAVTQLPLPIVGEAQKQTLQIRIAPPPDPQGPLYIWLHGESAPRVAKVRP